MIGWRVKQKVIARDADGNQYELEERLKLIETTTSHSGGRREIVEGDKKWYFGANGLVAGTDKFSTDGSLEVEGSSLRLWLKTP